MPISPAEKSCKPIQTEICVLRNQGPKATLLWKNSLPPSPRTTVGIQHFPVKLGATPELPNPFLWALAARQLVHKNAERTVSWCLPAAGSSFCSDFPMSRCKRTFNLIWEPRAYNKRKPQSLKSMSNQNLGPTIPGNRAACGEM